MGPLRSARELTCNGELSSAVPIDGWLAMGPKPQLINAMNRDRLEDPICLHDALQAVDELSESTRLFRDASQLSVSPLSGPL